MGGNGSERGKVADQGNAFFTDAQDDLVAVTNSITVFAIMIIQIPRPGTEVKRNIVAYLAELTQMTMVIHEAIFKRQRCS
jgi:hypothetical protein